MDRETAFSSVYTASYADLIRFVQRRAPRSEAEDVVADAYLVVWRRLEDLPDTPEEARAWVFGIARHVLLNRYRTDQRQQALGVRLAQVTPTSPYPMDIDGVISRVDVAAAWSRLSEVHQEALTLAVLEQFLAPHAAMVLGISPVAFRLRLSRARRALRLHLNHLPHPHTSWVMATERTNVP